VQREQRLSQAVFERAVENDIIDKNAWAGIDRSQTSPDPIASSPKSMKPSLSPRYAVRRGMRGT
jgi:hypothetical protein